VNERILRVCFMGETAERLDKYLAQQVKELSRSRVQQLIAEGFVEVDGVPAAKSGQMLDRGQEVVLRVPGTKPSHILAEDIPLDIVFESSDLLVINKPAAMVVHPAPGHVVGTLTHAVLGYEPDLEGIGGEQRPGVVHRLDKDTSGLILFAKNDRAHRWLQEQFRQRLVEKTYIGLVDGKPPTPSGRVEAAIGRDPRNRKKMAIDPRGKSRSAISTYRTIESFEQHTLLEIQPLTGRTHQIRLHCAFLGCPIVGDEIYGRKRASLPIGRHFLHAARLKFVLPDESSPRTFETPLPPELVQVLERLRTSEHRLHAIEGGLHGHSGSGKGSMDGAY